MLATILSLIYELGVFYIVFTSYLLFFGVSIKMDRKKTYIIFGYATAIILLCFAFSVEGDILYIMLLTSLLFGRRKLRDTLMIFPASMLYVLVSVLSGSILDEIFSRQGAILIADMLPLSYLLVDGFLLIGIIYLRYFVQKKQLDMTLRGREIVVFFCYFFFGMFVWLFVKLVNTHWVGTLRVFLGLMGLFFYYAILCIYIHHLVTVRKSATLNQQIKTEDNHIQMLLLYLEKYKAENEEIRELRHDLRGHLQVMQNLYEKKDNQALEKYIKDLVGKTETIKELQITGNQAADIVISRQKERAEKENIIFTCNGDFESLNQIKAVDVCTLFSNLLDNAYEASIQVTEPFISIKGVRHRNYYIIEVSNRTGSPVKINNGSAETTKKGGNHGNGMGIVNRVVTKYHGECVFQCEEKIFSCKIMLPLDREQQ